MSKQQTGFGYIFKAHDAWHTRIAIRVRGKASQKSVRLCSVDDTHPTKESVVALATAIVTREKAKAMARVDGKPYNCHACGQLVHTRKPRIAESVAAIADTGYVSWRNSYSL
jgi:hypothetical protein